MKATVSKGGALRGLVVTYVAVCLALSSLHASTCIVSLPDGDRDPCSSLASTAVPTDAGGGAWAAWYEALETAYRNSAFSVGIGITTLPFGTTLYVR